MKKIIILGATGSIGKNTLSVIRNSRDDFLIAAISAHTSEEQLLQNAHEFDISHLCLSGKEPDSDRITYTGSNGLLRMIEETDADIVVNGIAGSPGLLPSAAALHSGKHLALANKETIVMAGRLINELADKKGINLLPVDSEHSAVFQLLRNRNHEEVAEIILTASGGPFRNTAVNNFKNITLADALKHPTWSMGKKISIDSATMANKGLEVIEAHGLFNIDVKKIKVLIHPESMVHSLIRTLDGEMYAQISKPDMRIPIQNALTYPDIKYSPFGFLDLAQSSLSFYNPDKERFPLLFLAYEALEWGGSYPLAFNAANETAVNAFIRGNIGFTAIHQTVMETLNADWSVKADTLDAVMEIDRSVRTHTAGIVKRLTEL